MLLSARRSAHVAQHASLIAGATKHAQVARGAWAPTRERPDVVDLERVAGTAVFAGVLSSLFQFTAELLRDVALMRVGWRRGFSRWRGSQRSELFSCEQRDQLSRRELGMLMRERPFKLLENVQSFIRELKTQLRSRGGGRASALKSWKLRRLSGDEPLGFAFGFVFDLGDEGEFFFPCVGLVTKESLRLAKVGECQSPLFDGGLDLGKIFE